MLYISGSNASLGKHWTSYFLRRNPSLKAMKGTHIEKCRAEAVIIIMLSRLLFACGASTQFDLQGKPCIGRVKTPVA